MKAGDEPEQKSHHLEIAIIYTSASTPTDPPSASAILHSQRPKAMNHSLGEIVEGGHGRVLDGHTTLSSSQLRKVLGKAIESGLFADAPGALL